MTLTVRVAGLADKEEVFRLFREAHKENGIMPYDMERVAWWIMRMLSPETIHPMDTGPRGVIGVIGKPDHLEGAAFLVIGRIWYATQPHIEELAVYVDPKYRRPSKGGNSTYGNVSHQRTLIEWMKEQSTMTGLPLFSGIMTTHRTEAKIRLYEKMLPKVGAVFHFNPLTASSTGVANVMVH